MSSCFKREYIAVVYRVSLFALKMHQFYRKSTSRFHKLRGQSNKFLDQGQTRKSCSLAFSPTSKVCAVVCCIVWQIIIESWVLGGFRDRDCDQNKHFKQESFPKNVVGFIFVPCHVLKRPRLAASRFSCTACASTRDRCASSRSTVAAERPSNCCMARHISM